jgi:ABC-2 type transport system ATP-binding protein
VRGQTVLNIAVAGGPAGAEANGAATEAAARALEEHDFVEKVEVKPPTIIVTLKPEVKDYCDLATLLIERGFRLSLFREEELNLETAFMALTKGITS